jgi:two-component sensor histidine kinase
MYLQDNSALIAIRDSQSRVHCVSLIHKKLYQSENIATIDMKVYIKELVDYLSSAFGVQETIRFELDIEELHLTTAQSIPVGLILNEAITNSIKYAFPQVMEGNSIAIHLSTSGSQCRLSINDNGIGLPAGFDEESVKTLGVSLMKGLSEDIEATFSMKDKKGTCVEILFAVNPVSPLLELPG